MKAFEQFLCVVLLIVMGKVVRILESVGEILVGQFKAVDQYLFAVPLITLYVVIKVLNLAQMKLLSSTFVPFIMLWSHPVV